MTASSMRRFAGFTLPELMIAVVVLAVLVAAGAPSFLQTLRNYQVRVAAESIANGLQRARAEAVTKNATVKFVVASDTSWAVSDSGGTTLDSRANTEGSQNATLVAVASDLATAATTITFNNLGQVVANSPASQTLARVTVSAPKGNESLQIRIAAGGNARVCDPRLPSTNPRGC